ncbi:ClpP/crotonase-like domain-containing protein [Piptocephalis cylindrospora]|uniref:ClpP/crotonase-like domain-containing protein n=1 Tax=Piptocephalis cylindrospora TaxID=1907219 RepID=A0A4P9XZZ5_9FUNG|nr:ClpP/crotonase-like domain-containing protein [Piptocephalis cylindrospora]|eukprot:RKP11742.1 ClpP/crotonase-like domain-containing protein [Piptocephalis cylindrospora]
MVNTSHFPSSAPKDKCLLSLQAVKEGTVLLLTMHAGENRFNTAFCNAFHEALDEVDRIARSSYKAGPHPLALVTVGEGKFYSNGLDVLEVPPIINQFLPDLYHPILRRLLPLPIPTIAAINGHAFAGGFLLAAAHDYRVMRSDRGFLCMNEVDLPGPLSPGMAAVLRAKFPNPAALRDSLLHARRFNATESLELGLVDAIAPESDILGRALDLASSYAPKARAGRVYGMLKEEMWRDAADRLNTGGVGYAKL